MDKYIEAPILYRETERTISSRASIRCLTCAILYKDVLASIGSAFIKAVISD
ncbi:hypothetical protein [Paenibacillus sp. N3.4]|uniref:hypothetical protein n=1 Tax=Paenibacillus sp. N3.4 TaxID=2603222 RepID=UPI001C9BDE86|nr:hypothetical protein [Paenibacillus sp. N3.4]